MKQLSFSLPVGTTPEKLEESEEAYLEIAQILNAIQYIAFTLDAYTGMTPVPAQDRSQYPAYVTSRLAYINRGYAEAAETLTAGTLVHFNASGKLVKAQANVADSLKCQAIVTENAAIGAFVPYVLSGVVTDLSGLAPGTYYYLSTSAGLLTTAAPAGGETIQVIGFAISPSQFYFNPSVTHL